ncbi:MAG: anaerobic ribonucleoside-triphosphate reductase activating protein [Abditibacteriota bacterium]|nr:anaerobic ribonucleoside-triphosphate reductase activating protein [Abditibacteriota bacterium]
MNYCEIKKYDIANGDGVRVSLFVSGCRNHCPGCFNPETWDFNYGDLYTEDVEKEITEALKPEYISGLTVLGGDPFEPENIEAVTALCKRVKELYPEKTIWVYTGYYFEDFKDREIMKYIDILVDGPFEMDKKDISLRFRGSSNQRILNIKDIL